MKITKKSKILLGIPVAFLSPQAFIGGLFGYFSANYLSKFIPSLLLNIRNYKLHIHHWLFGLIFGIFTISFDFLSPLINPIFFGFLAGIIFQGISNYPDWYKILVKQ